MVFVRLGGPGCFAPPEFPGTEKEKDETSVSIMISGVFWGERGRAAGVYHRHFSPLPTWELGIALEGAEPILASLVFTWEGASRGRNVTSVSEFGLERPPPADCVPQGRWGKVGVSDPEPR